MKPEPRQQSPLWCWSCNAVLDIDTMVHLDEGYSAPCCLECWQKIPVEQRLRIAQMFRDRQDGGLIDSMTTLFRSSLGRFMEERGGDEWLRGTGN